MQRARKATQTTELEMPDCLDPSGVPCADGVARRRAGSSRRRAHRLPGLTPASMIASVHGVAVRGEDRWLVWGCVDCGPVLFVVDAGAAAEMISSVEAGEMATAIIEPWQVVLERLD